MLDAVSVGVRGFSLVKIEGMNFFFLHSKMVFKARLDRKRFESKRLPNGVSPAPAGAGLALTLGGAELPGETVAGPVGPVYGLGYRALARAKSQNKKDRGL